jgi:hypothetical protein
VPSNHHRSGNTPYLLTEPKAILRRKIIAAVPDYFFRTDQRCPETESRLFVPVPPANRLMPSREQLLRAGQIWEL